MQVTADDVTRYQRYLEVIARSQFRAGLRAKLGVSDVVQQTLLAAVQNLDQFHGDCEEAFRGWLRQILVRQICHLDRDMHRDCRNVDRERSMEAAAGQSSMRLQSLLAGDGPSPSVHAAAGEAVLKLVEAIQTLPAEQQRAVELHYLDGLKLAQVAEVMDKTPGAVAGLIHRGVKSLRASLVQ